MEIKEDIAWIYYIGDTSSFIKNKVGKWMYFFENNDEIEDIKKICSNSVIKGIVGEAKHTNPASFGLSPYGTSNSGVCCFYLNYDDNEGHKKILAYFIENNMIRKTKTGKFYNISFKLDNQTRAREYGKDFHSEIKLSNFIDLSTGEWLI